ncbi:hypothetical protein VPHK289_0018 [Vibrio phage K289]|nr:hypothetical protein PODOV045v1_p0029 [Vibrio phage 69E27.1]
MWGKDTQDSLDLAGARLSDGEVETSFGQNLEAQFDNEIASGLSISRYLAQAPIRDRNQRINEMAKNDDELGQFRKVSIDPVTGYPNSEIDYDAAADYLVQRGDDGFESTATLNEQIQKGVQQADEYAAKVSEHATFTGHVGGFVGGTGAQVLEPVNYVAVIPGIGQASVATKVALGAAEGALASTMVQPTIKRWKNDNDIEYTTKDMLVDVGLSAAFGGTLSGLTHYAKGVISRLRGEKQPVVTNMGSSQVDTNEGLDAAADRMVDFEREAVGLQAIEGELDNPMTAGDHFDVLDEYAKTMQDTPETWEMPPADTLEMADIESALVDYEQALGIERTKPEVPEGTDVSPYASDDITIKTRALDFEIESEELGTGNAKEMYIQADKDKSKLSKTLDCMLGGSS